MGVDMDKYDHNLINRKAELLFQIPLRSSKESTHIFTSFKNNNSWALLPQTASISDFIVFMNTH